MRLKPLPAQRAYRIARVDYNDGEKQVAIVSRSHRVPELIPPELAETQGTSNMVKEVSHQEDTEGDDKRLPRLQRHELAEYGPDEVPSSRDKQFISNGL